ncbi:hypothetical protein G9A89_014994 [Geosiphon pyriformis]|nr:hypothetical protein G9A89_014994 [Geosiphon pyriformis]
MNALPKTPSPFSKKKNVSRTPLESGFTSATFNNNELENLSACFLVKYEAFVQETRKNMYSKNKEWTKQLKKDREMQDQLLSTLKVCEEKTKQLGQTLANEAAQMEKAQLVHSDLEYQVQNLSEQKQNFSKQIRALEDELHKLQAIKVAQRQSYQLQFSRNEPELRRYMETLKMTFEGIRADVLLFHFKCISDHDSERVYSFILNLSEQQYRVTKCNLPTNQVNDLVDELNRSRDFFGFLKKIRKAFRENYKNER